MAFCYNYFSRMLILYLELFAYKSIKNSGAGECNFLLFSKLCQSIIPLSYLFTSACESPVTFLCIDSLKGLRRTSLCHYTYIERERDAHNKILWYYSVSNLKAHGLRLGKIQNCNSRPQNKPFLHVCLLFKYSLNSSRTKSKANVTVLLVLRWKMFFPKYIVVFNFMCSTSVNSGLLHTITHSRNKPKITHL
jgi:hypothetical protein